MRQDLLPKTLEGKTARVIEECGEVLKAIGKIGRFGNKATDPKTKIEYDNVRDLKVELLDLRHAIDDLMVGL